MTAWREGNSKPVLRGADAFAAFFYGDIGQADHIEKALDHRDYVHFHFDQIRVNSEHGCAKRLEEHPKMPFASSITEEGVSSCGTVAKSLSQKVP
ncbi:MAG: hypothetical protein WCA00_14595 [Candidatus Acidiferrales bacterium]